MPFEEKWNYTVPPLLTAKYTNIPFGQYYLEIETTNAYGDYLKYKDIFKNTKISQLSDQKESYNITNKHDKIFRTILDKKKKQLP